MSALPPPPPPGEFAARRVSLPIIEPSMELDTDEEELIVAAAARRRARDKARGAETLVTRLKRMVGASTCASRTVPTLLQRGTVASYIDVVHQRSLRWAAPRGGCRPCCVFPFPTVVGCQDVSLLVCPPPICR